MTIYEFADVIGRDLVIRRYANQGGRWTAEFDGAELKDAPDSGFLAGVYGNGVSPEDALSDYLECIKGKWLVFDAYGKHRREYNVPDHFEEVE